MRLFKVLFEVVGLPNCRKIAANDVAEAIEKTKAKISIPIKVTSVEPINDKEVSDDNEILRKRP